MKTASTHLVSLGLLFALTSCGDVSSNNKTAPSAKKPESPRREDITPNSPVSLKSQIHREKGAAVLTTSQEILQILGDSLPAKSYRLIPSMEKDNEGSKQNVSTVSDIGRPNNVCGRGPSFASIEARITDCADKNGSNATWNGERHGAAGEGTWKLVSLEENSEIWMDTQTGLVWSPIQNIDDKSLFNWCQASGNTENSSALVAVDCNDAAGGVSVCVNQDIGSLGSQVKWRLPTRNDYLQADINGLRFILPREFNSALWTATLSAQSGNTQAWVYHSIEGTLSAAPLTNPRQVRCVGAAALK
jgi:hypothetical protein